MKWSSIHEVFDTKWVLPFESNVNGFEEDLLPPLFNVLKGDMALIGPRPLLVKYLPLYTAEQMRRHEVRDGHKLMDAIQYLILRSLSMMCGTLTILRLLWIVRFFY